MDPTPRPKPTREELEQYERGHVLFLLVTYVGIPSLLLIGWLVVTHFFPNTGSSTPSSPLLM